MISEIALPHGFVLDGGSFWARLIVKRWGETESLGGAVGHHRRGGVSHGPAGADV